jgi:uncharacterized protein (TIGR02996 family)
MAPKRTKQTGKLEWVALADTKDPEHLGKLLATLEDTSLSQLEHRFLALALWPSTPAIGAAAAAFFHHFPVRSREQLGAGCAALGALVVHGAPAGFAKKQKKRDAPNDLVPLWRALVARTAATFLESKHRAPVFEGGVAGPALPKAPRAALQQAWLARAALRREADLAPLLACLADGPATDVTERLSVLVGWPRSAAIADAAAQLIERPIVRFNAASALFPVLALVLAAHGDASHAGAATRLGGEVTSLAWLGLVMSTQPRTEARAAPSSGAPDSELDFLRWLAAAPEDLTRRHAFADWLLEQGNPRGEFMALQLAALERPLDEKQARRVAALQNKHQREWLKPFWKCLMKGSQRFEGGVLRAVSLTAWSPQAGAPAGDEPQLATLHFLDLDGSPEQLAPIVKSPLLQQVRHLRVPAPMVKALEPALTRRLESFGVHLLWGGEDRGVASAVPAMDQLELPAAKTVVLKGQVRNDAVPRLRAAKWPGRIEVLEIESIDPASFWAYARASSLRSLIVSPELGENGARHGQLTWCFTRTGDGWRLDVSGAEIDEVVRPVQRSTLLHVLPTLDEVIRAHATVSVPDPTGALTAPLRQLGLRPAAP